jgi:MFS family permease
MNKTKKILRWLPPRRIRSVYVTISLAELSTGLATPLFTFIFFSSTSTLFASDLSNADRAMYFALFLSFYNLAKIVSNPVMGSLSDILGRKKIFSMTVLGMLTLAICTIIALVIHSFWLFVIGAFIYAFAWALKAVAAASINDVSLASQKIKNLSLMQFCIGIGVSIGPVISGYIGDISLLGYDYIFPFIILGIFSLFLLFYVKISVPETLPKHNQSTLKEYFALKNLKEIFANKAVYLLMIIHIFNQLSWGTYYDFIPAVSKTVFDYGIKGVGFMVGIIGLWLIVATGIILPFIRRYFSNTQLINISCVTGAVGVTIAYISSCFPNSSLGHLGLWISTFPVATGDVILFCLIVSYLSASVSKKYQGTIVGLVYIIGTGMWAIGAPIGGLLMKWQMNGALLICPVSMFILLIFLKSFQKKEWFLDLNVSSNNQRKK